jgi:hypothetical protein
MDIVLSKKILHVLTYMWKLRIIILTEVNRILCKRCWKGDEERMVKVHNVSGEYVLVHYRSASVHDNI